MKNEDWSLPFFRHSFRIIIQIWRKNAIHSLAFLPDFRVIVSFGFHAHSMFHWTAVLLLLLIYFYQNRNQQFKWKFCAIGRFCWMKMIKLKADLFARLNFNFSIFTTRANFGRGNFEHYPSNWEDSKWVQSLKVIKFLTFQGRVKIDQIAHVHIMTFTIFPHNWTA